MLVNNNLELKKPKKVIQLLIDGKSRKIVYNKTENIYYYTSKNNKIDVTSYFKVTDGSLKKKYKKMLVGGGYKRPGKIVFKGESPLRYMINGNSRSENLGFGYTVFEELKELLQDKTAIETLK